MKSLKLALLAAVAVMAVAPAMAQPDTQNDNWRHGARQGRAADDGARASRPTPPQAQAQPAQQQHPQPQASAPQPPQQQRGNWGGGGYRPSGQAGDQRAQWMANRGQRDRGNAQPAPQAGNPDQRDRGQWSPRDGARGNRNDGQQRDRGDARNFQNNGPRDYRDYNAGQGNRDNRNSQWNRDNRDGGDRRWDNGNVRRGDSRQWNGNRYGRSDHRPDLNWRSDRRYDWNGWRNTHRNIFNRGRYNAPRGYGYRSVYRGFFLEPLFYGSNYWLADPYEYRLPPAEWPYRWVRYYDDALLVDTTNGEVVDVIQDFFY